MQGFAVPGYNTSLHLEVQHLEDYVICPNSTAPLWHSTLPLVHRNLMVHVYIPLSDGANTE